VSIEAVEKRVHSRLNLLGVLASEMIEAKLEVAKRMYALIQVRAQPGTPGWVYWEDVVRICRIVASNVRRSRKSDFREVCE
jgi:hypothetical protein